MGVCYLIVLLVFALIGPSLKHSPLEPALLEVYDAGIRGDASGQGFEVNYVRRGTPADLAGIKPLDIVTRVDNTSLAGLDTDTAIAFLRGKKSSIADLTIQRNGQHISVHAIRSEEVRATPFMDPSKRFWLGTDEQGRDVFARLTSGARTSLIIGFTVQILALVIGVIMGTLGVFAPKWISVPVLRLTDGMFAFPDILLAILIVGVWNKRFEAMIIALAITAWPAVARLVRTQIATLKEREYVVASKALGAGTIYLVVKHILPHLWGIVLAVAMIDVAGVILAESALSFLGIGIQAPTPSWGGMIEMGRANMNSYPIMLLWPCLALSLTVFALNFVGDGLRAIADPRSN